MPEGWAWSNLSVLTDVYGRIGFRGYTKNDFVEKGKGAITLSPSNIIDNKMDYSSCSYISWDKYEESPEIMIQNKDILLVKTGSSYGKSAFVENLPEKATINPQFVVLKETRINPEYLCYFLQSGYAKNKFNEFVVGTAIPTFSQANLNTMHIAIPGFNEQCKIVQKISVLLKLIEIANDEKESLKTTIFQLKSKILDLAICGKLVPQDPNDEPASVLLERIRAEKEELIKQGKIKRDKKESIIFKGDDNSYYEKMGNTTVCIDEELPFEIPDNWTWSRLQTCCCKDIKRGKSPKYANSGNALVFAQKCNTKYDGINLNLALFLDETTIEKYSDTEFMQNNDIVINSTGNGTLGRVGIYKDINNTSSTPIVPDSHVTVIRSNNCIMADYLYAFLKSSQSILEKMGEGSTNQKELKPITLKYMLVPIPPYKEQMLIVDLIKKLNTIIRNVEANLN
ncbi:restriction endonuclease subunit S [Ruminococcus sp.]|uniref:restriction endonuclease subunit S n=1 Tax=Ruminococcus sp. TaxID=41978 RepID=UPI003F05ACBB